MGGEGGAGGSLPSTSRTCGLIPRKIALAHRERRLQHEMLDSTPNEADIAKLNITFDEIKK